MNVADQIAQIDNHRREMELKAGRGAGPVDIEAADPEYVWDYEADPIPANPGGWGSSSLTAEDREDTVELAAFNIRRGEVRCSCGYVHSARVRCEDVW